MAYEGQFVPGQVLYGSNEGGITQDAQLAAAVTPSNVSLSAQHTTHDATLYADDSKAIMQVETNTASLYITADDTAGVALDFTSVVTVTGLPTTDPAVAGRLWNNNGVLSISLGP